MIWIRRANSEVNSHLNTTIIIMMTTALPRTTGLPPQNPPSSDSSEKTNTLQRTRRPSIHTSPPTNYTPPAAPSPPNPRATPSSSSSTLQIRSLTLHNRIFLSPLCRHSPTKASTPWHHTQFGGIVQRGLGLSFIEATAVSVNGRTPPKTRASGWTRTSPVYKRKCSLRTRRTKRLASSSRMQDRKLAPSRRGRPWG